MLRWRARGTKFSITICVLHHSRQETDFLRLYLARRGGSRCHQQVQLMSNLGQVSRPVRGTSKALTSAPYGAFRSWRVNHTNTPTFLFANCNANHPTFFHNNTNRLGRQLHTFFTRKHLHFLGPDFPTFYAPGRTGRPDLCCQPCDLIIPHPSCPRAPHRVRSHTYYPHILC